jgi:hypothetical protein
LHPHPLNNCILYYKRVIALILRNCRKTDENYLFVELDNNKQVEYRVKSPKFLLHVFQYYYLNIETFHDPD